MVDANPNRIVADIASPTMVAKMLKHNPFIDNTDAFLNNCYDKAALTYFDSFKRFFTFFTRKTEKSYINHNTQSQRQHSHCR